MVLNIHKGEQLSMNKILLQQSLDQSELFFEKKNIRQETPNATIRY